MKSVTRAELVLQSHTRVPTHLQHEVYRDGVTSKCHLDNLKAATENKWIESVCTDLEAMYGEEFRSTGEFLSHNLKFYLISHERYCSKMMGKESSEMMGEESSKIAYQR